jgi:ERCC4-related helicase
LLHAQLLLTVHSLEKIGVQPQLWQLEAACSILKKCDTFVIAGTGSGKTMVMILVLLADPKAAALIIVPLKALMEKQVHKLILLFLHFSLRCLEYLSLLSMMTLWMTNQFKLIKKLM